MTPTIPDDPRARERARHADTILRAAISAADPAPAVRRAIAAAQGLSSVRAVHVAGIGKAAGVMTCAALEALSAALAGTGAPGNSRVAAALAVVPHNVHVHHPQHLRVIHAAHPVPDESSVAAAREVEKLLRSAAAGDLVIVLLSGGASSLCAAPVAGMSIDQYADVVRSLLRAGADIHELNTVRAHIDRLKGGGMAHMIAPARALGLVMSDVVGNAVQTIASGPLSAPASVAGDASNVLAKYGLDTSLLDSITGTAGVAVPGGCDAYAHVDVRIVLDNSVALAGAAAAAQTLGYDVRIIDAPVTGDARTAGSRIARTALAASLGRGGQPICMVSGGETTVAVTGSGRGGRNQELALAGAVVLNGSRGITIGSIGTDGIDGPTDAAGAIVDGYTAARGAAAGQNPSVALDSNDSHTFLAAAGGLLRTGPTHTNVMDVQVVLIDREVNGEGLDEGPVRR